jgi:hypothetical protein
MPFEVNWADYKYVQFNAANVIAAYYCCIDYRNEKYGNAEIIFSAWGIAPELNLPKRMIVFLAKCIFRISNKCIN